MEMNRLLEYHYTKFKYHKLQMKKHKTQMNHHYHSMLSKVFYKKKKNLEKFLKRKGEENKLFGDEDVRE